MENIAHGRRPDGWPRGSSPRASGSLLLDLVSGAVAGYGLRKLRNAYAGKSCNVRRSSDNLTQDIGFAGTDFDIAGFNAWIGAGSGFVTKWYDQSGGGHDAVQATAANQPQITLAATANGRPALTSAGTTVELDGPVPATSLPLTLNAVVTRTGNFAAFNIFLSCGNGDPGLYYNSSAGTGIAMANLGVDSLPLVAVADNQFHSATGVLAAGGAGSITVDRTQATGTLTDHTGATSVQMFATGGGNGLLGSMCEAIYFHVALVAADIATLGSNQQSYYGTP